MNSAAISLFYFGLSTFLSDYLAEVDFGGLRYLIAPDRESSAFDACLAEFLSARIYSTFDSYSLSYSFTEALRSTFPDISSSLRLEERVGIAYRADFGVM